MASSSASSGSRIMPAGEGCLHTGEPGPHPALVRTGYTLSGEEHSPGELLRYGRIAEEAGFDFLTISDHFHPWTSKQGQSPFVWSVLGGLAVKTERVPIMTAVTCPTIRLHPAIV